MRQRLGILCRLMYIRCGRGGTEDIITLKGNDVNGEPFVDAEYMCIKVEDVSDLNPRYGPPLGYRYD